MKLLIIFLILLTSCQNEEKKIVEAKFEIQTIELIDFLNTMPCDLTNENKYLLINNSDTLISLLDSLELSMGHYCNKIVYSTGNRYQIANPNSIYEYLKQNDIEILYIDTITGGFMNQNILILVDELQFWWISFSCGSHGCGMYFSPL